MSYDYPVKGRIVHTRRLVDVDGVPVTEATGRVGMYVLIVAVRTWTTQQERDFAFWCRKLHLEYHPVKRYSGTDAPDHDPCDNLLWYEVWGPEGSLERLETFVGEFIELIHFPMSGRIGQGGSGAGERATNKPSLGVQEALARDDREGRSIAKTRRPGRVPNCFKAAIVNGRKV